MKRTIVSLVQPGRTRKEVLEPTAYPESKDDGGQEHAVKAVGYRRRLGSSAARPARRVKAKLPESQLPTGVITAPIDTTPEVDVSLDCVFML